MKQCFSSTTYTMDTAVILETLISDWQWLARNQYVLIWKGLRCSSRLRQRDSPQVDEAMFLQYYLHNGHSCNLGEAYFCTKVSCECWAGLWALTRWRTCTCSDKKISKAIERLDGPFYDQLRVYKLWLRRSWGAPTLRPLIGMLLNVNIANQAPKLLKLNVSLIWKG